MLIRREQAGDEDAIAAVHRSAFATGDGAEPDEVGLVAALRADPAWIPELALVAVVGGRIVGHACITAARVGDVAVGGAGPIGVLSEVQGDGVGSALMHAVLGAADALGLPLVGLVGHLGYYPRFGFVPAADVGIVPTEPDWATHFQIRTLSAYEPSMTGEFRYAAPFYAR